MCFLFLGSHTELRLSALDKSEALELNKDCLTVRFTDSFRLGKPPVVYTNYPIRWNTEYFQIPISEMKLIILDGGKDNAIAFGLTTKPNWNPGTRETVITDSNYVLNFQSNDEENFYLYKYNGKNGYIHSQTETTKHLTENIMQSRPYSTGDVVSLYLDGNSQKAIFSKNEQEVGEVTITENALRQQLYPFVSLNTPGALVRAEFTET